LARGTINGTAQLKNITKNMTYTSDLNVSDLIVYGNPVGNLAVKVNNNAPNLLNADIALSGNNNDVKILGDYNTSSSTFDMNMAINQLQMKSVQGFSMNAITNTEGYLSGNLKITGTASKPNILGKVKFNDVGLEIAKTGSDFRKLNDEINFTNRGIEFDNFKINDKDGNALRVDGQVLTQTYRDFAFNLDVDAQNFKVVNSEKSNDAIMYGVLSIDAGLHIRGNLDLPKVDGRLAVADNTDFTFVLPQSSPTLQERDGIVEFIDQDQVVLNKTIKADSLNSQSKIKGMDVNVNIEISKKAKMSLLIDKANGDFVKLQGEAELTGGVDPSGKTTLVGVYEVESGSYEMTVSVLKRKFDIQKGSTITWTGEPTTANLDITAVYKTEAAPIDLVEQQISGEQASTLNQFKQRIPFSTLLKMKGELLKPVITFDITTDKKNNAVSSTVTDIVDQKLSQLRTQESEMNKQVFALLLLNRFVGENPFESGAGLSGEMLARQSVSKILSQQLNNLASDLIKGVDLNFDLESSEDYSTGSKNTRTDLNVGVSKKLLNDRLKVSVGSNFALEGEARQNENMTNIAGDVTVDYSLSRDGRYMLRAYRKNEYQVALQGQIVETGVGFIITLDYDKFREIFQKSKNRKPKESRKNQQNQAVEFK
jgi:TamB, inner membrane protein subunit of TAM complex